MFGPLKRSESKYPLIYYLEFFFLHELNSLRTTSPQIKQPLGEPWHKGLRETRRQASAEARKACANWFLEVISVLPAVGTGDIVTEVSFG